MDRSNHREVRPRAGLRPHRLVAVATDLWTFRRDSDGNGPGFDLALGPYSVTFSCYGLEGEQMNEIIDVMNRLGFQLYDGQTCERFRTPP